MAKVLPERTLVQARDQVARMFYGGDDPFILAETRKLADAAIIRGGIDNASLKNQIQRYVSGDTSAINEAAKQVHDNEYRFTQDPDGFINERVTKLRKSDLPTLTTEELQAVQSQYQDISNGSKISPITGVSTEIGSGLDTLGFGGERDYKYGGDLSQDLDSVNSLIDTRLEEARKEADVQGFLKNVPEELRTGREAFGASERARAGDTLRSKVAPDIAQYLNANGLLDSGEFGSLFAGEASNIEGAIEQRLLQLEEDDAKFFAEASYNIHSQKLQQSESDLRSQIGYEREKSRTLQNQSFQSTQSDLDREFDLGILKREQERALRGQAYDIQQQNSERRNQSYQADMSNISNNVATTAGLAIAQKRLNTKEVG
jgi:hypothetical protein